MARLRPLDLPTWRALADADLPRAAGLAGVDLDPGLLDELWLWRLRCEQLDHTPDDLAWLAQLLVVDDLAVGHVGCHTQPDADGVAEIGYWVSSRHRGRGHGALGLELLEVWARRQPRLRTLQAFVGLTNDVSTHLVERAGYRQRDQVVDGERLWELDVSG